MLHHRGLRWSILVLAESFSPVHTQLSTVLWPPFAPLAVRSPYLSAWINISADASGAPQFWRDSAMLGCVGLIRVDQNVTYSWQFTSTPLIGSNPAYLMATVKSLQVTPTQTTINLGAGPIDLNVTYLSPIEPDDLVKQSLPFTYFSIVVASTDNRSHEVQVYYDITMEWISGDREALASWNTTESENIIYHELFLASPIGLSEVNGQAVDGTIYFAAPNGPQETTAQVGDNSNVKVQFSTTGLLDGTTPDYKSAPITFENLLDTGNVLAISMNLGHISNIPGTAVWALGMLRDPVVQAITASGASEMRIPAWRSQYNMEQTRTLIEDVLQDYNAAKQRADAFDIALVTKASAISPHLADLISVAARQVIASTELTITGLSGTFSTTDVRMYMKNIGASISSGRMNPVEVMYTAFPFFLTLNASYGAWLLMPILEYASSPNWTELYAPGDLGVTYPQASRNSVSSSLDIEETGNMLIMILAHARASGDGSLIGKWYQLLRQWADYLVNNTWPLHGDSATPDRSSPSNSTILALKGIIAIGAMSQLSSAARQYDDAQRYSDIAQSFARSWISLALGSDQHILGQFGGSDVSWSLPYNLFADKWLGTNLFNNSLYASETSFIQHLSGSYKGCFPIGDTSVEANTAWISFSAAIVTDATAWGNLITPLWTTLVQHSSLQKFSTTLDTSPGISDPAGSPGVGALFAQLALNISNTTIVVPHFDVTPPSAASHKLSHTRFVAGTSTGGVLAFLFCITVGLLWPRQQQRRISGGQNANEGSELRTEPTPYTYTSEYRIRPISRLHPTVLGGKSIPALDVEPRRNHSPSSAAAQLEHVDSVAENGNRTSHPARISLRQEIQELRQAIERLEGPPPTYRSGET